MEGAHGVCGRAMVRRVAARDFTDLFGIARAQDAVYHRERSKLPRTSLPCSPDLCVARQLRDPSGHPVVSVDDEAIVETCPEGSRAYTGREHGKL